MTLSEWEIAHPNGGMFRAVNNESNKFINPACVICSAPGYGMWLLENRAIQVIVMGWMEIEEVLSETTYNQKYIDGQKFVDYKATVRITKSNAFDVEFREGSVLFNPPEAEREAMKVVMRLLGYNLHE